MKNIDHIDFYIDFVLCSFWLKSKVFVIVFVEIALDKAMKKASQQVLVAMEKVLVGQQILENVIHPAGTQRCEAAPGCGSVSQAKPPLFGNH